MPNIEATTNSQADTTLQNRENGQSSPIINIRQMFYEDCDSVRGLIIKLQIHQKMLDVPRLPSADDIREELFYSKYHKVNNYGTFGVVAEHCQHPTCSEGKRIIGYMLYHNSFSIIGGKRLFLTSFFIEEAYRRCGVGQKLMSYAIKHAHSVGITRFDVPFMKVNQAGISFYKRYGAELVDEEYQIFCKDLEKLPH